MEESVQRIFLLCIFRHPILEGPEFEAGMSCWIRRSEYCNGYRGQFCFPVWLKAYRVILSTSPVKTETGELCLIIRMMSVIFSQYAGLLLLV